MPPAGAGAVVVVVVVVVAVEGTGGGGGECDSITGGGAALLALEASSEGEVTPLAESWERYFSKTAGGVRVCTKRMSSTRAWRRWVRIGGLNAVRSPWRRAKGRAADAMVGSVGEWCCGGRALEMATCAKANIINHHSLDAAGVCLAFHLA